jgi:hypothetical protein
MQTFYKVKTIVHIRKSSPKKGRNTSSHAADIPHSYSFYHKASCVSIRLLCIMFQIYETPPDTGVSGGVGSYGANAGIRLVYLSREDRAFQVM